MNIKDGLREDNCNPILLENLYKNELLGREDTPFGYRYTKL